MNTEFTYLDERVMVRNDNGDYSFKECHDNITQELEQENKIETLSNLKKSLKDRIEKIENSKVPSLRCGLSWAVVIFLSGVIPGLISKYGFDNVAVSDIIMTTSSSLAVFNGVGIGVITHLKNKKEKKEIAGIREQIRFINDELQKENKALRKLQKTKANTEEITSYKTTTLSTSEEILKEINPRLQVADDWGRNGKKYYQYHLKSQLEEKIEENYTEEQMEQLRGYAIEKGPRLVKSRSYYKKKK